MKDSASQPGDELANASREEIMSALFANMVIQQTNMAMLLLGKAPHPETGEMMRDLQSARMFIEQLEMIEAKTKGNLNKQEDGLLRQALASVHMAFVDTMNEAGGGAPLPAEAQPHPEASASPAPAPAPEAKAPTLPPAPAPEPSAGSDESRKKFSKKY